jgi:hypothetical protein
MAEAKVRVVFEAVDKASQAAQNLKDKLQDLGKASVETATQTSKLQAVLSQVAPFVSATVGATTLIATLKKMVGAWSEEEQSILKLRNAVKLAYQDVDRATAYFEALAQTLQSTYGIADSTGREMIAFAIRMGVPTEKIKEIITVAIDMSRALGIDSTTALEMLVRASNGATFGLRRMGIVLDEQRLKTEGLNYILDEVGKKFKGMGEEYMGTVQGAFTNSKILRKTSTRRLAKRLSKAQISPVCFNIWLC